MSAATRRDEDRDAALAALLAAWKEVVVIHRRLRARDSQRPDRLSMAHFLALSALEDTDELPAGRLAAKAELSPAATTQMLDHLERQGMVRRQRSADDRRVVTVSLTDLGRERLAARRADFAERYRDAMADLSPGELAAGAAVLERMRDLLEGYARSEEAEEVATTRA
ncbi:MAG TPA: MarR family transcriptional regulator [Miltoncostaeaceae bacterium]|nr:MarR family transcriptional regulator [Miltoncostaeaceae bacterium]